MAERVGLGRERESVVRSIRERERNLVRNAEEKINLSFNLSLSVVNLKACYAIALATLPLLLLTHTMGQLPSCEDHVILFFSASSSSLLAFSTHSFGHAASISLSSTLEKSLHKQ